MVQGASAMLIRMFHAMTQSNIKHKLRVDKAKLGVVAYTYNLGNSGGLDRRVAS